MLKFLLLSLITSTALLANERVHETLKCIKEDISLSATVYSNKYDSTLGGLRLNDSFADDGYKLFETILLNSKSCEDLHGRALTTLGEVLVCRGELFTPKGKVYGQVLLTKGSLRVFQTIAAEQGWSCSLI